MCWSKVRNIGIILERIDVFFMCICYLLELLPNILAEHGDEKVGIIRRIGDACEILRVSLGDVLRSHCIHVNPPKIAKRCLTLYHIVCLNPPALKL